MEINEDVCSYKSLINGGTMKRLFLFLLFTIFILNSSVLFCDLQQYEEREPVSGESIIRFAYSIDTLDIQHINGHIEIGGAMLSGKKPEIPRKE